MSEVEELDKFKESYEIFRNEISKVIIGQDEVIKNVLDGSTVQFDKYLEVFQNDKVFVNHFTKQFRLLCFLKQLH